VAVGAQKKQVLEPVVVAIAVDVVEGHGERLAPPNVDLALLAAVLLQAGAQQPSLDVVSIAPPAGDEQFVDRDRLRTTQDSAPLPRLVPRPPGETESLLAFGDRVTRVVIPLDLLPVVAAVEALVDLEAEPTGMVGHGRLGQAQDPSGRQPRVSLSEKRGHLAARVDSLVNGYPRGSPCGVE
jgi:hypothetical protein